MTTQQKKEQLSIHYVSAVAAYAGCHMTVPTGFATGVDLVLSKISDTIIFEKRRLIDTGALANFQVKSTTEKTVSRIVIPAKNVADVSYFQSF